MWALGTDRYSAQNPACPPHCKSFPEGRRQKTRPTWKFHTQMKLSQLNSEPVFPRRGDSRVLQKCQLDRHFPCEFIVEGKNIWEPTVVKPLKDNSVFNSHDRSKAGTLLNAS